MLSPKSEISNMAVHNKKTFEWSKTKIKYSECLIYYSAELKCIRNHLVLFRNMLKLSLENDKILV